MTTQVQICNKALANVNESPIDTFNEASNEADICRLHYDDCRIYILSEIPWQFAAAIRTLVPKTPALSTSELDGWKYAYNYPDSNVLRINSLFTDNYHGAIDYIISTRPTGVSTAPDYPLIFTNAKDAKARVTIDFDNVDLIHPQFIESLVWRLTSLIAVPLAGIDRGNNIQRNAIQAYNSILRTAMLKNVSERRVKVNRTSNITKSRW